ncbi:MAG: hypothetical protein ACKOYJ_10010 [Planctomycetia bacterium]
MHTDQGESASRAVGAIGRLRRRLDRAVAAAVAMQMLGWLGRMACIAVIVLVSAAACDLLLSPTAARIGVCVAAVALVLVALAIVLRFRGLARPAVWPGRLDVARAVEKAHPELGERLSRAIEFLDDRPMHAPADLTGHLQRLAIEEAAREAARYPRLPWPGLRTHAAWGFAAAVAAAALIGSTLVLPVAWSDAVRRQLVFLPTTVGGTHADQDGEPVPGGASPTSRLTAGATTAPSGPVAEAALRLAAAAAVERRLAALCAERFADGPGVAAESLSPEERHDRDTLAAFQRETIASIRAARDTLASVEEPSADVGDAIMVLDRLAFLDAASAEMPSAAIASNRLAIAATEATRIAQAVAVAASVLGISEVAGAAEWVAASPAAAAKVHRTMRALGELERRPVAAAEKGSVGRLADATEAADPGRSLPEQGGASADRDSGAAIGGATAEPRFAADDAATLRPIAGPSPPVDLVWQLFPESTRPFASEGGRGDVPAAYAPAVDLYYELLRQSLSATVIPGQFHGRSHE